MLSMPKIVSTIKCAWFWSEILISPPLSWPIIILSLDYLVLLLIFFFLNHKPPVVWSCSALYLNILFGLHTLLVIHSFRYLLRYSQTLVLLNLLFTIWSWSLTLFKVIPLSSSVQKGLNFVSADSHLFFPIGSNLWCQL